MGLGLEGDGTWGTLKQTKNQTKNLPTQVSSFNPITHGWPTTMQVYVSTYRLSLWKKNKVQRTDFMFYVWDETAKQEKQEQSAYSFKVG